MKEGTTMPNSPVRERQLRPNLKQEVAQHVRDLILSGSVRPGQRLDQEGIAYELGVSRLPVREALIMLEAEGLVENIARRGSFVASLEPADIIDHFEMYGLISGLAAARAANVESGELTERLTQISAEMRSASDPKEHDRLNFAFHQAINKAGGSRRLLSVLRTLSNNMPTSFFAHNTEWAFKDKALDEHDAIVDALRRGDGEGAAKQMAEHFANTGEQAVRMLKSVGFWNASEETSRMLRPSP